VSVEDVSFLREEMRVDPALAAALFQIVASQGHAPNVDGFLEWAGEPDNAKYVAMLAEGAMAMKQDSEAMQAHDEAWLEARRRQQ